MVADPAFLELGLAMGLPLAVFAIGEPVITLTLLLTLVGGL